MSAILMGVHVFDEFTELTFDCHGDYERMCKGTRGVGQCFRKVLEPQVADRVAVIVPDDNRLDMCRIPESTDQFPPVGLVE